MKRRLAGLALLVAVFLAGAASGAAAWHRLSPPRVKRQVSVRVAPQGVAVYESLGLSPEQRQRIDSILSTIQPRTDSLLRAALPRLSSLVEEADSAIRTVLRPEQRVKLDSMTRTDSPAGDHR